MQNQSNQPATVFSMYAFVDQGNGLRLKLAFEKVKLYQVCPDVSSTGSRKAEIIR